MSSGFLLSAEEVKAFHAYSLGFGRKKKKKGKKNIYDYLSVRVHRTWAAALAFAPLNIALSYFQDLGEPKLWA